MEVEAGEVVVVETRGDEKICSLKTVVFSCMSEHFLTVKVP